MEINNSAIGWVSPIPLHGLPNGINFREFSNLSQKKDPLQLGSLRTHFEGARVHENFKKYHSDMRPTDKLHRVVKSQGDNQPHRKSIKT